MKLVPIIAIFAFAQGTLARSNLCKLGQRYCGSAMKQFDNAGDWEFNDNELYACENFEGTPPGNLGQKKKYRHAPVIVQTCPKTCHIAGEGKSDYCTGEKLFNDNEELAECSEKAYKKTAQRAIKTKTKLDLLYLDRGHYGRLLACVYAYAKIKNFNTTDKDLKKQIDDLLDDLWDGQQKATEAVRAEEDRLANV